MTRALTAASVGGMILSLLMSASCVAQGANPGAPPARHPDAVVDRILTRLEDRTIGDLKARILWELEYVTSEADEPPDRKAGRLWYKSAEPDAKFKVTFTHRLVDGKKQKLDEDHLFDGHWYVELQRQQKLLTRREVRAAGDKSNPYRLGEGVFPLPFGQKKSDILADFDVTRIPEASDDPKDTDHLRLFPRENSSTGRLYTVVEFWIARDGKLAGLPIQVRAGKRDGTGQVNSYIRIKFDDVELNDGMSDSVFKIEKPPGFTEHVEPLKAAGDGGGGAPPAGRPE